MRLRAVLVVALLLVVGACADGSDTGEGGPTSTTTTQVPTTTTTQVPTTTTTLPVPTVTWPRYPDWLVDVEWLVIGVEMDGVPVDRPEGAEAHVTFESDGILAGSLGCNGFGSGYDDFENPGFISVGMTMARCEDVEDWVEVADVLQGVYEDTGFSLDRDEATGTAVLATAIGVLNLRDPDPPESSSAWPTFSDWLVGVEWQVTAVEFGGEPIDRPEGAEAFVVFEPDGLLSGHLGCNGLGVYFVGTFEQPESIGVGSTDMGCEVKDWYEVAYVLQGVYDNGITSLRQHEATGTVWLSTAYGLLELHDPAVVPSQTPAEAARDGVVPELAAYPYGLRVKALLEVEAEEGTWVLADLHAGGGLPERIGDDEGVWPQDYVSRYDYGETLLTDGAGRILKAWPMPDLGPSWILVTDDRVYVGREQGSCGLASTILRIDRTTLETDRVAFSRSGDLHPYVLPGWHVADSEAMDAHLPIFWQPGTHDGEGVEAETFAIRYIVDVEAADRFIEAVVAETDPVPADDWFC